ncbi:MAG: YdcF family protein [Rhodanobacteraceae bacterium]
MAVGPVRVTCMAGGPHRCKACVLLWHPDAAGLFRAIASLASPMKSLVDRISKLAWVLLLATTVLLIVASTPAVASWLERDLIGAMRPASNPAEYPHAAAIVVLGGEEKVVDDAIDADPEDSSMTRLGLGRLLLLSRRAPVILLSGGKGEAIQMKSRLLAQGVPAWRILTEARSRDTRENALDSAPILHRLGANHVLLVTSSIHMRRAAGCFRKLGFNVVPAPSPELPEFKPGGGFWKAHERALKRSEVCLHELFGLWEYQCLGWI